MYSVVSLPVKAFRMQYFEVLSEANFLCKDMPLLGMASSGKRLCEKRYERSVNQIDRAALERHLLLFVGAVQSIKAPLTS